MRGNVVVMKASEIHDRTPSGGYILLHLALLSGLLIAFGGRFLGDSIDVAVHYLLVDEIMKHGGIRPERLPDMAEMAVYPPASHWLAAIVGWVGGSGLVGLMLVSVASLYAVYYFVARLVQGRGVLGLVVFLVIFVALSPTRAQIGWELVVNFFYPQLVGDVAFFGMLYWLAVNKSANPCLAGLW